MERIFDTVLGPATGAAGHVAATLVSWSAGDEGRGHVQRAMNNVRRLGRPSSTWARSSPPSKAHRPTGDPRATTTAALRPVGPDRRLSEACNEIYDVAIAVWGPPTPPAAQGEPRPPVRPAPMELRRVPGGHPGAPLGSPAPSGSVTQGVAPGNGTVLKWRCWGWGRFERDEDEDLIPEGDVDDLSEQGGDAGGGNSGGGAGVPGTAPAPDADQLPNRIVWAPEQHSPERIRGALHHASRFTRPHRARA